MLREVFEACQTVWAVSMTCSSPKKKKRLDKVKTCLTPCLSYVNIEHMSDIAFTKCVCAS